MNNSLQKHKNIRIDEQLTRRTHTPHRLDLRFATNELFKKHIDLFPRSYYRNLMSAAIDRLNVNDCVYRIIVRLRYSNKYNNYENNTINIRTHIQHK